MSKTIKYILLAGVILAIVALFIFNENVSIGAIVAGVTALFAAIKSRLLRNDSLSESIATIENEHAIKRNEWDRTKEEYDSKFRAMKARMDYLDYRSKKIAAQIEDLDVAEQEALEVNERLSDEEILERLNNL